MESLLERGEKLDDLVSKSEVLGTQSKAFYKTVSLFRPALLSHQLLFVSPAEYFELGRVGVFLRQWRVATCCLREGLQNAWKTGENYWSAEVVTLSLRLTFLLPHKLISSVEVTVVWQNSSKYARLSCHTNCPKPRRWWSTNGCCILLKCSALLWLHVAILDATRVLKCTLFYYLKKMSPNCYILCGAMAFGPRHFISVGSSVALPPQIPCNSILGGGEFMA